ncbi:MAG: alanine--glyoxylate aminotransferase family protein [Planctomycetes bacterium]|nr:alanine--glyoxylate aminotransferase family protein [Planctomycetota bacterium]
MAKLVGRLNPSQRILMGPGPSNCHPRVLRAMSTPLIGHLDPDFLQIMDETRSMLRGLFRTKNEFTIAVSGTGSAGMETCFVNLIEPGDRVVIGINGVFGERMTDVAARCGAKVVRVESEWGKIIEPDQIKKALARGKTKVVALVHAETSTGAATPIEEISKIAHSKGALLLVDTVTSLGGMPVDIDKWKVDACYSGTQKCLSCPPGLAPVTFSEKAMKLVRKRKRKVQSWYLDMSMVERYWGQERFYHHTAPISMIYALREALCVIHEEGLKARFARHMRNHRALVAGLEAMGLKLFAQEGHRLPMLNTVEIPEGVEDVPVRKALLKDHNIEIGGGLGKFKGKLWRIGLMGHSSTLNNVVLCLGALEKQLKAQKCRVASGAGVAAALATG